MAGIGRTPLLTVTPKNVRYPRSFSLFTSRAGEPLTDTMPLTARSQTTRLMPGRFRQQPIDQGEPDEATVLEHHNQVLDQTKPLLMNLNFLNRFLGSRGSSAGLNDAICAGYVPEAVHHCWSADGALAGR